MPPLAWRAVVSAASVSHARIPHRHPCPAGFHTDLLLPCRLPRLPVVAYATPQDRKGIDKKMARDVFLTADEAQRWAIHMSARCSLLTSCGARTILAKTYRRRLEWSLTLFWRVSVYARVDSCRLTAACALAQAWACRPYCWQHPRPVSDTVVTCTTSGSTHGSRVNNWAWPMPPGWR